ncbi:MAG TPA: DUF305 domain-containing protein, partial [Herpetosiphonaceae bacterium]
MTPSPAPAAPRQLSPAQQAEVVFLDGMAAHHAGAVVMASEALTQATTPEVRQLAQQIRAAQEPEIAQLARWRAAWYSDVPPTDPLALMAMHMGAMTVPSGAESYDSRFLLAMISHHQGAVLMAEELAAVHPELAAFASTVIADQTAEMAQMEQWLTAWGIPLPDPNAMQGMNHGPPPVSELVFLDALLYHHTGMLALASDAQQQSTRPELLACAQLLQTESTSATHQLRAWRAAWYPAAPPTDPALVAGIGMSEMAVPNGPQP